MSRAALGFALPEERAHRGQRVAQLPIAQRVDDQGAQPLLGAAQAPLGAPELPRSEEIRRAAFDRDRLQAVFEPRLLLAAQPPVRPQAR